MRAHQCYHCKQWVEKDEPHDCWTTTEQALTKDLSEELRDAYERLRETAADFGEQRIYASHHCIMFSRKACYFFVRPKKNYLELCVFLGRALKAPQVKKSDRSSKVKFYNLLRITHRDEVEAPITTWLREAYDFCASPPAAAKATAPRAKSRRKPGTRHKGARPRKSAAKKSKRR